MIVTKKFKYEDVLGIKFGKSIYGQPKLFTHIYFLDGLLIDTAQSRVRQQVITETKKLPIDQMYITHHHEDYTGNIKEIKEIHNCPVYAYSKCCSIMKNPPNLSLIQKITWGDREPNTDLIQKDNHIKTNKFHFEIIHIPGHAEDMVALYEPNRKWLFSADLYINSYVGYFLENESMTNQISSIKKVLKLDFDVMFCSHNPQLKNGKQHLIKKLNFLESFYSSVEIRHQKGYTSKEIFQDLNLRENWIVKNLSFGKLSKMNMVESVIRDIEK